MCVLNEGVPGNYFSAIFGEQASSRESCGMRQRKAERNVRSCGQPFLFFQCLLQ